MNKRARTPATVLKAAVPLVLVALLLIPASGAQINGVHAFTADYQYADANGSNPVTVVSAAMKADLRGADGSFGFFDTNGLRIDGVERVCWKNNNGQGCATGDTQRIMIERGGSIGLRLPDPVDATYTADHVLALWMDFKQGEDLNTFGLGEALLAPSVGGKMAFASIERIPLQGNQFIDPDKAGGLSGLDDDTVIRIDGVDNVEGNSCAPPSCRFNGKDTVFTFEGSPVVSPFQVGFGLLPFGPGSSTSFSPATNAAVAVGLKFARINEMLSAVETANAQSGGTQTQQIDGGTEDLEIVLQETLAGALMTIPTDKDADFGSVFRLNRFTAMTMAADATGLHGQGTTAFRVADGGVTGAQSLYGVWLFKLPWWGFALWAVAIGLWITRLAVKPEKKHERWDRYKWIGLVFSLLVAFLVFVLWDLEMAHVFGTSLFTTSASGNALWATIGIQIATLLLVFGVVATPIQMIIKNSLLLSRQGTFMGLGTGTGMILSYLLGATLLLSYLDLILGVML